MPMLINSPPSPPTREDWPKRNRGEVCRSSTFTGEHPRSPLLLITLMARTTGRNAAGVTLRK